MPENRNVLVFMIFAYFSRFFFIFCKNESFLGLFRNSFAYLKLTAWSTAFWFLFLQQMPACQSCPFWLKLGRIYSFLALSTLFMTLCYNSLNHTLPSGYCFYGISKNHAIKKLHVTFLWWFQKTIASSPNVAS